MKKTEVQVLVTPIVLRSKMLAVLKEYLESKDIIMHMDNARDSYRGKWRKCTNLITWGVKWPTKQYCKNGRNVLYLENGLLCQKRGIFIDHRGYFSDSSIVLERQYDIDPSTEEIENTIKFLHSAFEWKYGVTEHNTNGPILVVMQMNGDAPLRYHFPSAKGNKDRKSVFLKILMEQLPKGKRVLVRAHPREKSFPDIGKWPSSWKKDDNKEPIHKLMLKCSAVVTVNSTVATEALGLGIPVATLGDSTYRGSNVTLECTYDTALVSGILDFKNDAYEVIKYLACILRHQIPYRGKEIKDMTLSHDSVAYFMKNMNVDSPVVPKRKKKVSTVICIYCACEVKEPCCKKGCPKCGRKRY